MRRWKLRLFTVILGTALLLPLFAEKETDNTLPSAAVRKLDCPSDSMYRNLAGTVEDTLILTLRLLGSYEVIELDENARLAEEPLSITAERHRIDNILFGSIEESSSGIQLSLSVYNREKNAVVLTESGTADSIMDIFDVTDRITLALLEGFTNTHIAFGTLVLQNTGETRDYSVYVDGKIVGLNVQSVLKIPFGKKVLRIADTAAGRNVLETEITIPENGSVTVDFTLPYLYKDERRRLTELDTVLASAWHRSSLNEEIRRPLEEVTGFVDTLGERTIPELRGKYELLKRAFERWNERMEWLPVAELIPGGSREAWERIPYFIEDSQNEPMKRPALPVDSQPGSDIRSVRVARSPDQEYLHFLLELGNGEVSSEVVYQLGLFRPTYPELVFSMQKLNSFWNTDVRFIEEFGNDRKVRPDVSVRNKGEGIEGMIRIADLPIYDDIRRGKYALRFATSRQEPSGAYDDTFLKTVSFFSTSKEAPSGPSAEFSASEAVVWSAIREITGARGGKTDISQLPAAPLDSVYFPAVRPVSLDAKSTEWNGVHPCVDSETWEDGAPQVDINVESCSLARDGDDLYILVRLEGIEELVLENERLLELVIWGDELEERWQAFLELRLQNSRPVIGIQKARGHENEGIKSIEAGRYVYDPESGTIEIRFPLEQVLGYLSSKPAYRAELRISDYSEEWHKKSLPFMVGLY